MQNGRKMFTDNSNIEDFQASLQLIDVKKLILKRLSHTIREII